MIIAFAPQRAEGSPVLSVAGDVLTIDGTPLDFGDLTEGDTLPAEAVGHASIVGTVTRVDGAINVTVLLPHGADAPTARRFPDPVTVTSGAVTLPPESE